jgi:4-hydroxyphenylpyruvate dioxygenase
VRTSIATVSLSGDLTDKLAAIAQAGFEGVEVFENDFIAFDRSPEDVGKMVRDAGLTITVFQPFRDFEGMPEPQRAKAFDRAERKFDVMQALGTDLVLICSNVSPLALGGIDRAADDLRALGERAAKRGLRIGYEALAWGRFVNDHRDAWEIVRRADHPAVGLILDSFHTLARGIDTGSIRSIPRDKIFLVQLADAPRLDLDLLSWSRHFRNMPGQGDLPVTEFAGAVQATGYDGYWSLEVFNDQFRAGSARSVAVDGRRSLVLLEEAIETSAASSLPPRAVCEAVEFVEFAVDDTSADALESVFRGLGFRKSGTHKSKSVTVWKQGRIHLVVNREQEGFAHSFYVSHGPAVCALGLRVKDAAAAVSRARKLLATPFSQAVLEGELEIPAIRGVGGSLIYFLDRRSELADVWNIEFDAVEDAGVEAGLTAIDHVSQSMDYDEMLSWLLFYTGILDVTKTPSLDIADPGGLVRSQVVQNTDGSLRIPLNGSQSQRTLSGRFINEFFGSGVQHIAFATADIRATAERLSSHGLRALQIPENYYDDLIARFGLEDSFVAALAEYGILYDRDQTGEYLQLYTPTFADRFFFEIVERRGYAGFGAPNAPVRLAAQARLSRSQMPFQAA